jgi:hypothetical protein
MAINKAIKKVWEFKSSSGSKTYQTLLYEDGSTSCNCMGWTRRNPPEGRNCKHTRMVDMGTADKQADAYKDYTKSDPTKLAPEQAKPTKAKGKKKKSENIVGVPGGRKLQWQ